MFHRYRLFLVHSAKCIPNVFITLGKLRVKFKKLDGNFKKKKSIFFVDIETYFSIIIPCFGDM